MSRKKRTWYPGAIYHLMSRGNTKKDIYQEEEDYLYFLYLLEKNVKEYNAQLHAFCLMKNHYHLLLETSNEEIWKIMMELNRRYAIYFNEKYKLIGHLYQDRYKACLVENNAYFIQVSRYIHLNPVKAQLVTRAEDYRWSSYREMIGIEDRKYITADRTYAFFDESPQKSYQDFIEQSALNPYEAEIRESMKEDESWLPK